MRRWQVIQRHRRGIRACSGHVIWVTAGTLPVSQHGFWRVIPVFVSKSCAVFDECRFYEKSRHRRLGFLVNYWYSFRRFKRLLIFY